MWMVHTYIGCRCFAILLLWPLRNKVGWWKRTETIIMKVPEETTNGAEGIFCSILTGCNQRLKFATNSWVHLTWMNTLLFLTTDDLHEQGRYTTGCDVNSDSSGSLTGYLSVLHNRYLIHLQFQLYAPHVHVLDTPFACCPFNKGSKRGENLAVTRSVLLSKYTLFRFKCAQRSAFCSKLSLD